MEKIVIDKSVPLPDDRQPQPGRRTVFPWGTMEVGESFVVTERNRMSAASSASQYKKAHPGWEYTSLKQEDGTIRFWRFS